MGRHRRLDRGDPLRASFKGSSAILDSRSAFSYVRIQSMALHLIADAQANYERFVVQVKESGVVWGLKAEEGWAVCPSNEYECDVLPFWSAEAYARRHAREDWSEYTPTPIDLDSFIDHW